MQLFFRKLHDLRNWAVNGCSWLGVTLVCIASGGFWGCDDSTTSPLPSLVPSFVTAWGNNDFLLGQIGAAGQLTVDPSNGNVYVYDGSFHLVHVFSRQGVFLERWPTNRQLYVQGMAFDLSGALLMADARSGSVVRFQKNGTFIDSFGEPGSGQAQFQDLGGIAVAPDGRIYVADKGNDRIQVFGPSGIFEKTWGTTGSGSGEFKEPGSLAVDPSGNVYVADLENYRIQKFDAEGGWLKSWGHRGPGGGEFNNAYFVVAVDGDGNVVTVERWHIAQRFSAEGELLASWPGQREDILSGIAVAIQDGMIFTLGLKGFGVQAFDMGGNPLGSFGTPKASGPGQFSSSPIALTVAADGSVLVGEYMGTRVQRFDPDGDYVSEWSFPDLTGVLMDLATGSDGSVFALWGTKIERFSSTGAMLGSWSVPSTASGLCVDEGNKVWVTVRDAGRVFIYTAEGTLLKQWGEPGADPGELFRPTSISVRDGKVVIVDANALAAFLENGTFQRNLLEWESKEYLAPSNAVLDDRGLIHAVFFHNGKISVYGLNGDLRGELPRHNPGGFRDAAVGSNGQLYVVGHAPEGYGGQVLKFQIEAE